MCTVDIQPNVVWREWHQTHRSDKLRVLAQVKMWFLSFGRLIMVRTFFAVHYDLIVK